jgi:hypothetical protein
MKKNKAESIARVPATPKPTDNMKVIVIAVSSISHSLCESIGISAPHQSDLQTDSHLQGTVLLGGA